MVAFGTSASTLRLSVTSIDRRRRTLDALFRPRGVAVVGASRRPGAIGRQVVSNLVAGGYQGPVWPVNKRADVVLSMRAKKSVSEIEGIVDLAVLVVPPDEVLVVAEQCGKRGIGGLVVVTAGFREIGGVGIEREERLGKIARKYGMRVIGPNCMGVVNTEPAFGLNASFAATLPTPGKVAMVSQSGALGEAILADATAAGLGVAMFASVGNLVDVSAADLIEYWEDDPQVEVILLYLESFGDPTRFAEVARRTSRKKPIIAVKSGRSATGALAAGSHTGSIAGTDAAADTLLAQSGVLRVESFREMFSLAAALTSQPLPKGDKVAVVTNAGGPGILATDAVESSGLVMTKLSPKTTKALAKALPLEASLRNPVDLIASADAKRYKKALRAVVQDPGVDALLVLFVSPIMIDAVAVAEAIVEETVGKGKPTFAVVMGRQRGDEALQLLRRAGVIVYRFPEDAVQTLRMLVRRHRLLSRPHGVAKHFVVDKRTAGRLLKKRSGWLTGEDAERVLTSYGISFAKSKRVSRAADAVVAALELGFPVVLKAEADGILHKSEHDAVRTRLADSDAVFTAAKELLTRLKKPFPKVRLQVQAHALGHRELLIGMTRDSRCGPLFACGLGGVLVEALRDVAFRVAPIDDHDPQEMLASLKGKVLLDAFRGAPAVDRAPACEVMLRLQQLVLDFPSIQEVEVNPFIAGAKGVPSVAVDARIRVGKS